MSHTKGPWVVGYNSGISGPRVGWTAFIDDGPDGTEDVVYLPISSGKSAVAWVVSSYEYETKNDLMADANLIAAAPDLLEALEGILQNYKDNDRKGVGLGPIMKAQKAIAKAKRKDRG